MALGHNVGMVEGDHEFVQVIKVQVGGSVVTHTIKDLLTWINNEGSQNITTVRHGREEWTREIFVIDNLQEEKHIYGGEWNKTPWWRDLFLQNNNLPRLLEWN